MALQDILAAISAHADARITQYRKAEQRRISEMRQSSERKMAAVKQAMNAQKEHRRQELLRKAEAHALGYKKNVILRKKQQLLDILFQETLQHLSSLPKDRILPILNNCLKRIQKEKGIIRPAKGHVDVLKDMIPPSCSLGDHIDAHGGFLFISPTHEQNFTLDHLLLSTLRPTLEIDMAAALFQP